MLVLGRYCGMKPIFVLFVFLCSAMLGLASVDSGNWWNIKAVSSGWQGQIGRTKEGFAIFAGPEWGARAFVRNARTQYILRGCTTPAQFVTKFAPPSENDTKRYLRFVCVRMGLNANSDMKLFDRRGVPNMKVLPVLMKAMCKFESGIEPPDSVILKGIELER